MKNTLQASVLHAQIVGLLLGAAVVCNTAYAASVYIDYLPPAGTTALNGRVEVTGGRLVNISMISKDKTIEANAENFVIYGLNNLPIFGKVTFEIDVGSRYEFNADIIASDKDGNPLVTYGRYRKEYNYKGVRKVQEEFDAS